MNSNSAQLQHKLRQVFGSLAVNKSLVRDAGLPRLPQFVVEHLVANYVNIGTAADDLVRVREDVARKLPEADRRELLKAKLLKKGELLVIDKLNVRVDLRSGELVGSLTYTGENRVEVLEALVDKYPRLLTGGLWGAYRLEYKRGKLKKTKISASRLIVTGCLPFQVDEPDLEEFAQYRAQFTVDEWIDVLLTSVGYAPEALTPHMKFLLLARLLPAVEPNYNFIELGPRQTGKTYLLRNVSPSVYTASGANVSAASLFANVSSGELGIVGSFKVVVLDEIADTQFDSVTTISMLKDYLESGQFARGGKTYSSDASLVMTGNLEVEGSSPASRYKHLFEELPTVVQDTALLDRIHAYLPGWEIPKITPRSLSSGYGLIVDYLGQVLGKLRGRSRRHLINDLQMPAAATRRDVVAIEKTTSALAKLLYPHDRYEQKDVRWLAQTAATLRERVNAQLAVMAPGEFEAAPFIITPKTHLAVS